MDDELHINQTMLDRLVDGELSADERRRLVAALESRPDGWRQCALAFLEAQTWKREMRQIVRPLPSAVTPAAVAAKRSATPRHGVGLLALAASLLVAFGLGLATRQNVLSHRSPGALPGTEIASSSAQAADSQHGGEDVLTFWVRDEQGRSHPLRVPLVDAQALDRQLGLEFQSGLPAEVRDRLQQDGYEVQSRRRYAPLQLDNGGSMVVPVEDMRIVPVSTSVY